MPLVTQSEFERALVRGASVGTPPRNERDEFGVERLNALASEAELTRGSL